MSINNPYSQYIENQIFTASPGKLLIMAYDGAIRFSKLAKNHMKDRKLDEQSANIRKTQNILLELMCSLDPSVDAQLAGDLDALYRYMFDLLTKANISDDEKAIDEVIEILTDLRSAWAEAELNTRSCAPGVHAA